MTEHPAIKAIGFVGETGTGTHIMRQAAATLKRIHVELGGKNPVIVFDDADFERALDAVVSMIYSLNGQRCTSSSRLLVQEGIAGRFLAAKITHVPSMYLSELPGPHQGCREDAIEGHRELSRRARAAGRGHGADIRHALAGEQRLPHQQRRAFQGRVHQP